MTSLIRVPLRFLLTFRACKFSSYNFLSRIYISYNSVRKKFLPCINIGSLIVRRYKTETGMELIANPRRADRLSHALGNCVTLRRFHSVHGATTFSRGKLRLVHQLLSVVTSIRPLTRVSQLSQLFTLAFSHLETIFRFFLQFLNFFFKSLTSPKIWVFA